MPHKPTRLALLISVIGLGMPTAERALAEEGDGVAQLLVLSQADTPPAPRGADEAAPAGPQQAVEEPGPLAPMGEATASAIQELRMDEPPTAMDGAPPVVDESVAEIDELATVPDELATVADELAAHTDPDVDTSLAPPVFLAMPLEEPVQEPASPEPAVVDTAPARAEREPLDDEVATGEPPRAADPPQPRPVEAMTEALTVPQAPSPQADESPAPWHAQEHADKPVTAARPRGFLAALGHALRSFFLGPAPAAGPETVEPPKASARIHMAAGFTATLSHEPVGKEAIVVASHADKVLMSLAAVRDPENRDGSAQTQEIVVATESDKVMAQLALVVQESRAQDALSKRALLLGEDEAEQQASPLPGVAVAMSEDRLDHVRGGFTGPNGLHVAFGIERAVYVNGELVTTTRLNFATQDQPSAAAAGTASQLALIQEGAAGPMVRAAIPTVIQNALDGQKIQSLTTINATVNSLQVLRGLQLQSDVTRAIVDSLRR